MPYLRYSRRAPIRRRRPYRRTVRRPRLTTAIKRYVRRVVPKPELKRDLDGWTENVINSTVTPYINFEPVIAQGTALNQRIGSEIIMRGIYLRAMFKNNSTTTQMVRALVLSCANDTDTAPATMELFQDISAAGAVTQIQTSGTNFGNCLFKINKRKFHVHVDRLFKLGATGSLDGRDVIVFKKLVKLRSRVSYDAGLTGVGNTSKRFIILYLTSDPSLDAGGGAIELTGNHYIALAGYLS